MTLVVGLLSQNAVKKRTTVELAARRLSGMRGAPQNKQPRSYCSRKLLIQLKALENLKWLFRVEVTCMEIHKKQKTPRNFEIFNLQVAVFWGKTKFATVVSRCCSVHLNE